MRISDWSSDVCSSDLDDLAVIDARRARDRIGPTRIERLLAPHGLAGPGVARDQPAVEGGDEDLPLPCRDASGIDVAASEAAKAARYPGVIDAAPPAGPRILRGGPVHRTEDGE